MRRHGAQGWDEAEQGFRAATAGVFDFDGLDSLQKWFVERGMFGYAPTERMTAAYGELVRQGVDPEQAWRTSMEIFTYGTQGRSAAELSMNFVFFPFSFQKKYLTTVGQWMTDDLTRSIVLMDTLRMYDLLDERYDLGQIMQERIPALESLRKLNALSFGISPGRFGGINRPYIDAALGAADVLPGVGEALDPIQNLFIPQVVEIGQGADPQAIVQELVRSTLPAINDIEKLWENAQEQGHVIVSPHHVTERAEVQRAWDEWNELKSSADAAAREAGYEHGWRSVVADPDLQGARELMAQYKADISARFPAWEEARAEVVRRQVLLNEELNTIRHRSDQSPAEMRLAEFAGAVDGVTAMLREDGISLMDDPEEVPAEVYTLLQRAARQMAAAEPAFIPLYERYFSSLLGPIRREIR